MRSFIATFYSRICTKFWTYIYIHTYSWHHSRFSSQIRLVCEIKRSKGRLGIWISILITARERNKNLTKGSRHAPKTPSFTNGIFKKFVVLGGTEVAWKWKRNYNNWRRAIKGIHVGSKGLEWMDYECEETPNFASFLHLSINSSAALSLSSPSRQTDN